MKMVVFDEILTPMSFLCAIVVTYRILVFTLCLHVVTLNHQNPWCQVDSVCPN